MGSTCLVLIAFLGSVPSLPDLLQGVTDRERVIRGFRMTCHIDTLADAPSLGMDYTASEDVKISAEVTGRIRYESSGETKDQGVDKHQVVLGSFNGSEARMMRTFGPRFLAGVVDRERSKVQYRVDPYEFVTLYFHEPITVDLKSPKAKVVGHESWDGHPAVVVEVEYDPAPDVPDRKSRFWIDPARGFTVVKRAMLQRISSEWREYYYAEGFDHKEVQPGVWLPMRVVMETLKVTAKDPAARKKPIFGHTILVKEWELNPVFDDSEFTIAFADGINVDNRITGTMFATKQITDQNLSDQLAMAHLINDGTHKSRGWVVLWINVAIAMTWVSIHFYRRARRRTRL